MFNKIETYSQLLNHFENKKNTINTNSLSKLVSTFINLLRQAIEDPTKEKIDLNSPIIKLEYPVIFDKNSDFSFLDNNENFVSKTIEKDYIDIFKTVTRNIIAIDNNTNNFSFEIPKEVENSIKKKENKKELLEKYLDIDTIIIDTLPDKPIFFINFYPLVKKLDNKGYFIVIVGLDSGNYKISKWKKENVDKFWNDLLESISINNKQTSLFFDISNSIPIMEPKISDTKSKNLVKTSLRLELQKFGKKPKTKMGDFHELYQTLDEQTKKAVSEYNINVIGIENTQAQNQALFAVQKLLNNTNYKGNITGTNLLSEENAFKFSGYLPSINFTKTEFLEAYGVRKKVTNRGKSEYNSNERNEALKALKELSQKRYLFYYSRKYWKDGKEYVDLIKTVKPIFNITEGYQELDTQDLKLINEGKFDDLASKLKTISIEPSPLLVDQIDNYFLLKPANCYEEIRLVEGKTSRYVSLFIDFLRIEVAQKEINNKGNEINWELRFNLITLAHRFRMESSIKAKQYKRIKENIDNCCQVASKLNYITEYNFINIDLDSETLCIKLNPDKFRRIKEIDEDRRKRTLI